MALASTGAAPHDHHQPASNGTMAAQQQPAQTAAAVAAGQPQAAATAAVGPILVSKVLTYSDVSTDVARTGRIVLPRIQVQASLPELMRLCNSEPALPALRSSGPFKLSVDLAVEDEAGRRWTLMMKTWQNVVSGEHRPTFVLENTAEFVRANNLRQGDTLAFCPTPDDRMVLRTSLRADQLPAKQAKGGRLGTGRFNANGTLPPAKRRGTNPNAPIRQAPALRQSYQAQHAQQAQQAQHMERASMPQMAQAHHHHQPQQQQQAWGTATASGPPASYAVAPLRRQLAEPGTPDAHPMWQQPQSVRVEEAAATLLEIQGGTSRDSSQADQMPGSSRGASPTRVAAQPNWGFAPPQDQQQQPGFVAGQAPPSRGVARRPIFRPTPVHGAINPVASQGFAPPRYAAQQLPPAAPRFAAPTQYVPPTQQQQLGPASQYGSASALQQYSPQPGAAPASNGAAAAPAAAAAANGGVVTDPFHVLAGQQLRRQYDEFLQQCHQLQKVQAALEELAARQEAAVHQHAAATQLALQQMQAHAAAQHAQHQAQQQYAQQQYAPAASHASHSSHMPHGHLMA